MTTLEELGEEYLHAAQLQSQLIAKYTARKHVAHRQGNAEEEYRLRRKLYDLYTQRNELLDIAHHLKNYYTDTGSCIQ